MPAKSDPRPARVDPKDSVARATGARQLMAALGVGLGVGLAAFYLARILFTRPPLPSTALKRPVKRSRDHGG
jgi:hypothetical protein